MKNALTCTSEQSRLYACAEMLGRLAHAEAAEGFALPLTSSSERGSAHVAFLTGLECSYGAAVVLLQSLRAEGRAFGDLLTSDEAELRRRCPALGVEAARQLVAAFRHGFGGR